MLEEGLSNGLAIPKILHASILNGLILLTGSDHLLQPLLRHTHHTIQIADNDVTRLDGHAGHDDRDVEGSRGNEAPCAAARGPAGEDREGEVSVLLQVPAPSVCDHPLRSQVLGSCAH